MNYFVFTVKDDNREVTYNYLLNIGCKRNTILSKKLKDYCINSIIAHLKMGNESISDYKISYRLEGYVEFCKDIENYYFIEAFSKVNTLPRKPKFVNTLYYGI